MNFNHDINYILEFLLCVESFSSLYKFMYILDKIGNSNSIWSILKIRAEKVILVSNFQSGVNLIPILTKSPDKFLQVSKNCNLA